MEHIFGKIKRVTAKIMSTVLITSSILNMSVPVMAHGDEPERATVSLAMTEHGKLSFDGDDEMTMAVAVGTDVTVNVTPDDGYFADSLTVFTGDEDGVAVDVEDSAVTFTVEGDTLVTSTFYQNGSVGSAALKSVEVDEGKTSASVEDYIRTHADVQYVGMGDNLTRADVLTVTTSVVDGRKLADATLDKLWADEDGDGFSEHWDALLSQPVSHAVLFEVAPDADYYVGWAGANISSAKLTDWGASENNADAKMRDGFIVDGTTGLVYVPKSYTEMNDKGEPMVASSRIQLVYTVTDESATADFAFNSTMTDVHGDVAGDGKVSVPVISATTKVTLAGDDEALASVNGRTIDCVTVNGIEYTPDMGMWQYDTETGSLEFMMAPAGIHAMSVKMSENFGKRIANFFRAPTPSADVNSIGTWEFKSTPWAGQTFRTQGKNEYTSNSSGRYLPAVENPSGGRYEDKTIRQAMGWEGIDLSQLEAGLNSIERTCDIWAQDTDTVKINQQANLALTCGHVGVNANFENDPNFNIRGDEDGDGDEFTDRLGQHIRVFSVSGDEAIISVTVPTSHSQAGAGFFKINWRVVAGKLTLHKSSANPSITDDNDCYSLDGAEFTVYNAANQSMGVLRTNANGEANILELPEGSYTVRETKAPNGYLPAPDQTVTVYGGQTTTAQVQDQPSGDPMSMVVGKYDGDKEYSNNNLPQGSASLEGAEFTVEYYDTVGYDSYDDLMQNNVKPTRSWVVRTNKDGKALLSDPFIVSGDELYHAINGDVTIPRGSVAIYESKAPTGYKLNTDVSFQKIQENPLEAVTSFNIPEVPDSVVRGGVKITKHDIESGTSDPIGGASIDGTLFEVKSLNENPVIADGVTYTKGQVITTLIIKDGEASTETDLLPYGLYSIQEVKPGEGYLLTDNKAHEFRIENDGHLVNPINGAFENQVMRGDLEFTKKGGDDSDRLAGVAFKLTSETSGESHVIVTDENGCFSSSSTWNKHTHNTNGNDNLALNANGVIDSGELDASAGVWFGGTKPDDSKGALPYDTYSIEELRCTANEGYQLIDTSVIISRDGKVYDFGTLTDIKASIATKAFDPQDGDTLVGMGNVHITDKVNYSNLIPNRDYKLVAELHDTSTGDILKDENGEDIVAEKSFTANKPSGFEYVDFQISTYEFGGKTITVYEKLYDDSNSLIAEHTDKDDVNQQVSVVVPEIGTVAADGVDGDKNISTDDAATVIDTVAYKNLIPGKEYLVFGQLFEKKTGEDGDTSGEPLEVNGNPVTGYAIFTPEAAQGTVDVGFTFDSRSLKDDTQLVVYEALFGYDVPMGADAIHQMNPFGTDVNEMYPLIASHADINDLGQTVSIRNPHISTTAIDGHDSDKNVVTDTKTTVIDTVKYSGLIPGKEYTLKGAMQVKKTGEDGDTSGEPLGVNGNPVTAETTFTPETTDGTVDVTFTFDSRGIADKTALVAFESLERNGVEIAAHADIDDKAQTTTVHVTTVSTIATDGVDGDKTVIADAETTITDDVAYENAIAGIDYTMAGILMDADTGLPILTGDGSEKHTESDVAEFMQNLLAVLGYTDADKLPADIDTNALDKFIADNSDLISHLVFQKSEFTPEKYDGTVSMGFHFNANDVIDRLNGETKNIVVFEFMFKNGSEGTAPVIVASECDLDCDEQTVRLVPSVISTTATDKSDGDHTLMAGKDAVITDRVAYEGLIPGKEYTLKATLMDKETGEMLSVNDQQVTAELKFTPNSQNGTVDIDLGKFDASSLNGHDLVVFEELYKQNADGDEITDVLVAEHKDIEDEAQTVSVTTTPPGGFFGKTGGNAYFTVVALAALVVLAGVCAYYGIKNRRAAQFEASADSKEIGDDNAADNPKA